MINWRSRSLLAVLVCLLIMAAVFMPVQIRPAAYNQREPASGGRELASLQHRGDTLLDDDDGSGVSPIKNIDEFILNLYVVFHKHLDPTLYDELRLPTAAPDGLERSRRLKTGSLRDVVLGGNGDVTFFASNRDLAKEYNDTDPLFKFRIVNEWETQGYKLATGAQYGTALNEFGAMATIYHSQYTYSSWSPQVQFKTIDFTNTLGRQTRITLRNGLDDAFIGILQYDMRLTDKVITRIRRRIASTRRPTADYVPQGPKSDEQIRANALWGGNAAHGHVGNIRVAEQQRALRMSPMHQQARDRAIANAATKLKCCVFYSVQYPMEYLVRRDDPFTVKLLELYSLHFSRNVTYDHLTKFAILDAFVIPFSEFNRLVPFLEYTMRNGVSRGALVNREERAKTLKQLEQALALFLGLLGQDRGYEYVMMPLRHEPARD